MGNSRLAYHSRLFYHKYPPLPMDRTEHAHARFHHHIGRLMSQPPDSGPAFGPKFNNDPGVKEIRIGTRAFRCIGASPPLDHPHVALDMGRDDSIVCPYCSTTYRFDSLLPPDGCDPSDALAESSGR